MAGPGCAAGSLGPGGAAPSAGPRRAVPGRVSASSGTGARLRAAVLGEVGAVPVSRVSPPPIAALRSAPPRFDAGLGGVPASSPSGCAVAVRGGAGGGGRGHNAALRARGPLEESFDFFSIFFLFTYGFICLFPLFA